MAHGDVGEDAYGAVGSQTVGILVGVWFSDMSFLVVFLVLGLFFESAAAASASGSKFTQAMQLPMSEFLNSVRRRKTEDGLVSGELMVTASFSGEVCSLCRGREDEERFVDLFL